MEENKDKTPQDDENKNKKKVFTAPVIEVIDLQERNNLYAWSDSDRNNST